MIAFEYSLLIGSILILIAIAVSKFSDRFGIPALILFLGIGMLAGSEGIGGIYFDNPKTAQSIGIVALIFILFTGGLDTQWKSVKPVVAPSLILATIGVLLTALLVGSFAYFLLDLELLPSILLGAIISSTDAAAVFSVLNSKGVSLKGKLKPLLEFESGSNDPMAVFLTIGLIEIIVNPATSFFDLFLLFLMQMGIGALLGFLLGRLTVLIIDKVKIPYLGIFMVFLVAVAVFIYALTALLKGSGFLAIYIAAIIISNHEFIQKKTLVRFFEGMAFLSQIVMFLTLGLLVFPSKLISVTWSGLLLAFLLMFVARPVGVFVSLAFSRFNLREKTFLSWVGLRGAVPIILATFPYLFNLPFADLFFSLVFFIVLTSALLQGWSLIPASKLLKVYAPLKKVHQSPIEFAPINSMQTNTADLIDFYIPHNSENIGKTIMDLNLPEGSLVVLINRNENYIVPKGHSIIEENDILLILATKKDVPELQKIFLI